MEPLTAYNLTEKFASSDKAAAQRRLNRMISIRPERFGPLVITLAVVSLLTGCERRYDSLKNVIARHTEAVGGRAGVESVRSIQLQLHIVDPGFQVDGTYRAARPGRMRIDITAGGKHVYTEAFNGKRGWQWKGEGAAVDEQPEATAALRHGVELPGKLFGLHEMPVRGHKLALLPRENIEGANYYPIRLTMSDGYATTLYVHPASWLITRRRDFRPLHVDVDPRPTTIETVLSDFRKVGAIQIPFSSIDTDLQSGKVLETAQITKAVINPSIPDSVFETL